MKSAAQRALKWKEEGKATGAGTPVGWGRATDIVNGSAMSLDTVKRMYSFFSRHEVDKKGKDFYNTSNPSNGRIMWDAWGGDAGFSWSRAIVNRNKEASDLFIDFGKLIPGAEMLTKIFAIEKNEHMIKEGDFVMGQTSEGIIHGMVEHIMTEGGVYGVPGTEYAIQSMPPENPAMAVRIYEEEDGMWEPTAYSIGMMYKDAKLVNINNHMMEDEEDMDSEIDKAAKPNYGNVIKPRKGKPADKELYARVVAEAKKKFKVYPSAYANGWVVQEYKRRGGKYN
jgi:hypothetical protein